MSHWIDNDFLLSTTVAKSLYHDYAEQMPIIDYHNHLNPKTIAQDRLFHSITSLWLKEDHYKWRLMRGYGIDEKYITGIASDRDKFKKWAELLPYTVCNPIFHWSQLELARYFGIYDLLNKSNADYIFDKCNEMLQSKDYSPCSLLQRMNVEQICTTDDPTDDLNHHKTISTDSNSNKTKVYPTWRPDKILNVSNTTKWCEYIGSLSVKSGIHITNLDTLIEALKLLQQHFSACGCKVADIGVTELSSSAIDTNKLDVLISKLLLSSSSLTLAPKTISPEEVKDFEASMLYVLCTLNHKQGWVQQLHIGALRDNNPTLLNTIGHDAGCDSMADYIVAKPLANLLSKLEQEQKLSKTILYNLNPRDNDVLATMCYNFNFSGIKGKMQYGASWWFLDNYDGVINQLRTIGNYGLLSQFIGMTTDSRSFLSFTRHEYFRRILCEYLADKINLGHIPIDMMQHIGTMVQNICYNNNKSYFGI